MSLLFPFFVISKAYIHKAIIIIKIEKGKLFNIYIYIYNLVKLNHSMIYASLPHWNKEFLINILLRELPIYKGMTQNKLSLEYIYFKIYIEKAIMFSLAIRKQ